MLPLQELWTQTQLRTKASFLSLHSLVWVVPSIHL